MAIAAIPSYLGTDFSTAAPGHRFGMYLKLWGIDQKSRRALWSTHDVNYRVAGRDRQERAFPDENKSSALNEALKLTLADKSVMSALATRQSTLAKPLESTGQLHSFHAHSVAPFTTGLGNEHPLENGFAFLNPYGLPYLPGSGVKGVLRQAARELASGEWGETAGWDEKIRSEAFAKLDPPELSVIDLLFGLESEDRTKKHFRGVLSFWDVIPQLKGDSLKVEVMTPHQTHYYQKGESPHDSGSPNPICFLSVPPGSGFAFHVVCDTQRLRRFAPGLLEPDGERGQPRWQALLRAAFKHAYEWLGFGAKTAVGYGAMAPDRAKEEEAERRAEAERKRQQEEAEKRAREAEEQARREAQLEEERRRQQAFDALPENQKLLARAREAVDRFKAQAASPHQDNKQDVLSAIKPLREQAAAWPDAAEREQAAALLEAAFDQIGWHEPGTDKKKRSKQTQKKQDLIADIRRGPAQ